MNGMRIFQALVVAGAIVAAALVLPHRDASSQAAASVGDAGATAGTFLYVEAEPIVTTTPRAAATSPGRAARAPAGSVVESTAPLRDDELPETRVMPIGPGVIYYEAPPVFVNACSKSATSPPCS